MKKAQSAILSLVIIMALSACAGQSEVPKGLEQEGMAPYIFTEREQYLLQAFNLENTSQMILFSAPKEAITLTINVYCLEDAERWNRIGAGSISIGADQAPTDRLNGTFAMQLKENYAIDFVIHNSGKASFQTDEIVLDSEVVASMRGFLQEFQKITLNTEIPVALMVYDSGSSMRTYTLQDFFEPSKFAGMDMVQVVTLEFQDK